MKKTKLLAFHGDTKLKDDIVSEVKWHQEQDKILQGTYGSNGKYCAVGCSINSLNRKRGKNYQTNDHSAYEAEFGIPRAIAHLEDRIFEGLDRDEAKTFPLRFMEAIKPGADLSLVTDKFMIWLLSDKDHGVIRFARDDGQVAIKQVVKLYKRVLAGKPVTDQQWSDAADAAYVAATAARAAADVADAVAYVAADVADAAARAAANAADAVADAVARAVANAATYKAMADKLINLLQEAE